MCAHRVAPAATTGVDHLSDEITKAIDRVAHEFPLHELSEHSVPGAASPTTGIVVSVRALP
jgi:hypothetical protein